MSLFCGRFARSVDPDNPAVVDALAAEGRRADHNVVEFGLAETGPEILHGPLDIRDDSPAVQHQDAAELTPRDRIYPQRSADVLAVDQQDADCAAVEPAPFDRLG